MEVRFSVEDIKNGGDAYLCLNMFDGCRSLTVEKEGMVIEEVELTLDTIDGMINALEMIKRASTNN